MSDAPQDWMPAELREDPALKDFKDPASLAKAYKDTKAMVGNSIRPPGPDAAPEAKVDFARKLQAVMPELVLVPQDEKLRAAVEEQIWATLGRPADEKGYEAKVEGVELDVAALQAQAKAEGLTKAQFAKRLEKAVTEARTAQDARKAADAELRREWGQAYEERVLAAKAAALKLGVPESALAAIPPAQLKVWANVAKSIGGEGRQVGDQGANSTGVPTPAEAKYQLAEIMARKEYWRREENPGVSDHLREKAVALQKIIHGL